MGINMLRSGATASVRPSSLEPVARSLARSRRFPLSESLRRWLALSSITLFLAAICVGLVLQVLDMRSRTLTGMSENLDLLAARLAHEISRAASATGDDAATLAAEVVRAIPPELSARGRGFLISDPSGRILAATGTGLGSAG